jgi:DNA-binding PadR family transcriptional regulator
MSVDYTILGVLMETPAHGYSIKKYLLENFSEEFGINDGQLYPALGKLEARGWIKKRVVQQRRSPAKHLYRVTPEGEEAFLRWLCGEEEAENAGRFDFFWKYEFLQRCGFFRYLRPAAIRTQAERKREEVRRCVADLEDLLERMEKKNPDPYRRMIVDYGLRYQRMRQDWLEDLLAHLQEVEGGRRRSGSVAAAAP